MYGRRRSLDDFRSLLEYLEVSAGLGARNYQFGWSDNFPGQ